MKSARRRRQAKGAIELIEEATHLLRTASAGTLACYYVGALPFVLGLLYFWLEMARSPFAAQNLAGAALGMAALFLWLKFWQSVFAARLRATLAGDQSLRLDWRRCARLFATQAALQPIGLFLLPLALIPVLPFAWVYAFHQNLTALADEEFPSLRALAADAFRRASLWPGQNLVLLAFLFGFGAYVFLNWTIVCVLVPGAVKTLLGVESVFTRSPLSLLNTTFFTAMLAVTYLCVDPLVKAVYTLRCFYGESLQSGADLKAELRRLSRPAISLAVLLLALHGAPAFAGPEDPSAGGGQRELREDAGSAGNRPPERRIPFRRDATRLHSGAVPPAELDRSIQEVIRQAKYAFRSPREQVIDETNSEQGWFSRFLDRVGKQVGEWLSALGEKLSRLLRNLFGNGGQPTASTPDFGWMAALKGLLYVLLAAVLIGLGVLLIRAWRRRRRQPEPVASEPIQPVPDLTDENVSADQLPEDGWTRLARELIGRGEFRLALRAFYLASLASLAGRNLISLAKFKSNRDYERELQRRGHAIPALVTLFSENVSIFDRTWYGLHEIDSDLVNQFAANIERIKGGV